MPESTSRDHPTSLVDYADDRYHEKRHPEFLRDQELSLAWSYFADLVYFPNVKAGDKVLEFGGGIGNNLHAVSKRATVTMVEPAPIGRKTATDRGIRSVERLDCIKGELFDHVLCRHVLEHLDHPLQTLIELRQILKPNGQITMVLPFESPWAMPISEDLNHHLYCWNPRNISNLLCHAGFGVQNVRFEYYGAKRVLMPIYRKFGGVVYAKMVRAVGYLCRFREIVATAISGGDR